MAKGVCFVCETPLIGRQTKYCSVSCLEKNRYQKHKDKRKLKDRNKYHSNKSLIRAQAQVRYTRNRDRNLERTRKWYERHPGKRFENKQKRLNSLKSSDGCFDAQDILDKLEFYDYKCFYCGCELENNYHVDHMWPLSRGGSNTWENIAVSCSDCNLKKFTRTAEEFMEELNYG